MTDKAPGLQQLISLSQAMLEKAREESWDDVVVLEAERGLLIGQFFLGQIEQADADTVAAGIQSILSIDSDIAELGVLKRFDLAQTLQNMGQGKKAVKAYTA